MTYLTLNLSLIPRYTTRRAWREIWRWVRVVNKRVGVETHQSYLDIILRPEEIVRQDWPYKVHKLNSKELPYVSP